MWAKLGPLNNSLLFFNVFYELSVNVLIKMFVQVSVDFI